MIVLDTVILIIDPQFPRDARFGRNRQFLGHAAATALPLAITCQTLLEVVGKYSFNIRQTDIPKLAALIPAQYGLQVVPDPVQFPEYANCAVADLLSQMRYRMALGDAVNCVQIAKLAPSAQCLLTWNARHYQGKLSVPALTPDE